MIPRDKDRSILSRDMRPVLREHYTVLAYRYNYVFKCVSWTKYIHIDLYESTQ